MTATNTKKIVLLNQDPEIERYLKSFIPLLGAFDLEIANHLISALAKLNAFQPELLIYNLDSKQAHAREIFLTEIRKKHPNTKILAIAANNTDAATLKGAGVRQLLIRPFDLTDLSERVKSLLPLALAETRSEEAKLLIADDEPEINQFLTESFSNLGIKVFPAYDGFDALNQFEKNACNLALVDLKMPKLSGSQLIEKMLQSKSPPVPKDIILMTAALGESFPDIQRYNYSVIQKPIDINVLEQKILEDCDKFHLAYHHT